MNFKLALAAFLFLGTGCVTTSSQTVAETDQPVGVDPYEGWKTISPGNVISLRIPANCHGDPGAGTMYIVCPETEGNQPTPDMVISSDGQTVNIRRWENQEWNEWDKVIASLHVLSPLDRNVSINIFREKGND